MATIKKAIPKAQNGKLTKAELDALSHQKRGMGEVNNTYVKKAGSIMNETGVLTNSQKEQLKKYMSKAGTAKSIYEGLPNIGRMLGHGNSAADVPKGSQLEKQRKGGIVKKKMRNGGSIPKAQLGKLIKSGIKRVAGEAKAIKSGIKSGLKEGAQEYKKTKFFNEWDRLKGTDKMPKMPKGMGFKSGGKVGKMRNGGSLSGLRASNKRVGPVDPKGAFTKVQKKTLRGAKGKASLTKDKQLGATKMAKRGMSIKKK
jgi:hypothetical protein